MQNSAQNVQTMQKVRQNVLQFFDWSQAKILRLQSFSNCDSQVHVVGRQKCEKIGKTDACNTLVNFYVIREGPNKKKNLI